MYTMEEIKIKSKIVIDVVNLILSYKDLSVDRIFLVGSYASGRANDYSDIDYLVQLKGGKRPLTYPEFNDMLEIRKKLDNPRIHVIYGTQEAQQSKFNRDPIKYAYKEL